MRPGCFIMTGALGALMLTAGCFTTARQPQDSRRATRAEAAALPGKSGTPSDGRAAEGKSDPPTGHGMKSGDVSRTVRTARQDNDVSEPGEQQSGNSRTTTGAPEPSIFAGMTGRADLTPRKTLALVALEDDIYAGVVAMLNEAEGREIFFLVVIRRTPRGWESAWVKRLRTSATPYFTDDGEDEDEALGTASLTVKDCDGDGRPELIVRIEYRMMPEPAVGGADVTDVTVFNVHLSWHLKQAFFYNLSRMYHAQSPTSWKSGMKFRDLNGDGHPDIVISKTTLRMHEDTEKGTWGRRATTSEEHFIWSADTDTYVRAVP